MVTWGGMAYNRKYVSSNSATTPAVVKTFCSAPADAVLPTVLELARGHTFGMNVLLKTFSFTMREYVADASLHFSNAYGTLSLLWMYPELNHHHKPKQ